MRPETTALVDLAAGLSVARAYLHMMKRIVFLAVFAAATVWGGPAISGALDNLHGDKLAVLLFAKSRSDAALDKQFGLLSERRPELDARKIVVIMTAGDRESMAIVGYAAIAPGTARQLKREFEVFHNGVTGILIDKSGTEVMRWHGAIDPQEIFDAVDALPADGTSKKSMVGG